MIFSLFPSFFSSVTSRTKLGKIACGGIEDNNIIVPVLQMSCSAWTLVSVRLRIVEVHSQVNQNRKLGNTSGSALSQFETQIKNTLRARMCTYLHITECCMYYIVPKSPPQAKIFWCIISLSLSHTPPGGGGGSRKTRK